MYMYMYMCTNILAHVQTLTHTLMFIQFSPLLETLVSISDDNDTDISLEPSSRDDLPVGTFMYYMYLCMSVTVYTHVHVHVLLQTL